MSNRERWITRPKVRFSKSAESPEKLHTVGAFDKPTIRSVMNFEPRIKILKAPTANDEFETSSSPDEIFTGRSSAAGDAPDHRHLCPLKSASISTPCLTEILLSPENRTLNIPRKKSEMKILSEKRPENRTSSQEPTKKSSHAEKISKTSNNEEKSILPKKSSDKENVPQVRESRQNNLKVPENTPRTISESVTRSTLSHSGNLNERMAKKTKPDVARRVPEVAGKLRERAIKTDLEDKKSVKTSQDSRSTKKSGLIPIKMRPEAKKLVKTKSVISLMPCMKIPKSRDKSAPPMKKTILRDASAGPSRVYVGPGLPRSRTPEPEMPKREKPTRSHSEIHSGDKLKRPEYNSIVGTIKKLRDAREEKIVEDLEHLPAIYQSLVNGKVSSALDFGANEAIYRDLVDLSIDEKQLPLRLVRSKDPEPRKRDIVPKLSDFFVPTNDEEYRRAVYVRPPSPRVSDTWNPYKISDRIFSWKEKLDS